MTKRILQTAAELDNYQLTVLAGRIARREFEAGHRFSRPQRHAVLLEYLGELNAATSAPKRPRQAKEAPSSAADYCWQRPEPFRRTR